MFYYKKIIINLSEPNKGNKFNPLVIPYNLYKEDKDKGIELLEKISHYLFVSENSNIDLFWGNAATSLFIGLVLYMYEYEKEEKINLIRLYELSKELDRIKEELKNINKTSPIYINLSSVLEAPIETKMSIISVFNQCIKIYITRETLTEMMKKNDFELNDLQNNKTAIFIISNNKLYSNRLIPIIVEEIYNILHINSNFKTNFNIILDEFENILPIKDINTRSEKIRFTIITKSFLELRNNYGKENAELLRISIGNIIYLLANDNETLEEISRLCGNKTTDKGVIPLVTVEDLKLIEKFESIILIPRMNPIKTKMIADWQIEW